MLKGGRVGGKMGGRTAPNTGEVNPASKLLPSLPPSPADEKGPARLDLATEGKGKWETRMDSDPLKAAHDVAQWAGGKVS